MAERTIDWRQDLKTFRERMGGVSEAKKAWAKDQKETLKTIRSALQEGAATVPVLAAKTGIPAASVLWYVLALKRFGQVVEAGHEGDYLRYRLKEGSHEPASGSGAGQ